MAVDHPCPACGYSLVGHQIGSRCPECSLPIVPGPAIARPRELLVVGIRLIGVWFLAGAVLWIIDSINVLRNASDVLTDRRLQEQSLTILGNLVVGTYCAFGAPHLVAIMHRQRSVGEALPTKTDRSDKPE